MCHVQRRLSMLGQFKHWLSEIQTHQFCLACLVDKPEHLLACQHLLCETCSMDLGCSTARDSNFYELSHYPISTVPCKFGIRVRPATGGLRVLAIDGGGIRAAILIQFLHALQEAIGLSFGTSSCTSDVGRAPRLC
jgi:hypothetical protein